MPAAKDIKRFNARRAVWTILRKYVATMMGRFSPPEELITRVEKAIPGTAEDTSDTK